MLGKCHSKKVGDAVVCEICGIKWGLHDVENARCPRAENKDPDPTRKKALETALNLTCGDRNESYGPPFDNLSDCAALWTSYLNTKYRNTTLEPRPWQPRFEMDAEDVAWMMSLVKMTRSFQEGYHFDNYVDSAAYSAIAGECRERIEDDKNER